MFIIEIIGSIVGVFYGWTRWNVIRTVKREFPNDSVKNVMEKLDKYKNDYDVSHFKPGAGIGKARLQLAIIKLAERDINKIDKCVEQANTDYRDVLHWASYK